MVQELHQCLDPLLEGVCLLNAGMLEVAKKGPVASAPASPPPFPTPELEEKKQMWQVPEEPHTSEPDEAAHLVGELDLV